MQIIDFDFASSFALSERVSLLHIANNATFSLLVFSPADGNIHIDSCVSNSVSSLPASERTDERMDSQRITFTGSNSTKCGQRDSRGNC